MHRKLNIRNKVYRFLLTYDVLSRRNAYIRLHFYAIFAFMKVIF